MAKFKKGNKINLGRYPSKKTREKMSKVQKREGKSPNKGWFKKGNSMSSLRTGKWLGEKNWNWKGGISLEAYGLEFNEDLKEVIRNRDRRKCQICEKTELENKEKLSVHHIDYDKRNNDPKNLITLCRICHLRTNGKRKYWTKSFNNIMKGRSN